eukprot:156766_1
MMAHAEEDTKESINNAIQNATRVKAVKDIYVPTDLPLKVGLKLSIKEITDVDTSAQQYGLKGDLAVEWKASEQDCSNYIEDSNNYTPEYVPSLMFINDIDTTRFDKSAIVIKDTYNVQKIKFNIRFTQTFDVRNFPVDVQDLSLVFHEEFTMHNRDVSFTTSFLDKNYIKLNKTWISITGWHVVNVDGSKASVGGVSTGAKRSYDLVTFRVQIRRKWEDIMYRLILWLLIIGTMMWATFSIHPSAIAERLSYTASMALTVVAFQFIISSQLPHVDYLTLMDKYNVFIFSFVLFITIETILVGHYKGGAFDDIEDVDTILAIVMAIYFAIGNVYFLTYGVRAKTSEQNKIGKWEPVRFEKIRAPSSDGLYVRKCI